MKQLKILLVGRGDFRNNLLGTPKVHFDIKQQYEAKGHIVDVLDYTRIYPKGESLYNKTFDKPYTYYFWKYLQKHAATYDVIDANYQCVIYPKETFGFKGILMARSHGLPPVYTESEKIERYQKTIREAQVSKTLKTRLGNIYRSILTQPGDKEFIKSANVADILHCLNGIEYQWFVNNGFLKDKVVVIPNGLPDNDIDILGKSATIKHKENSISYIGSWTLRKGIKDMSEILSYVANRISIKNILLLGGHHSENKIRNDFNEQQQINLLVKPTFQTKELPILLERVKVGMFPSYVEGFGLAVVEQMACGIPVVAYKVPGPSQILSDVDESLLIEPGNTEAFSSKLYEILSMDVDQYDTLSQKCKTVSKEYKLSQIADQFLSEFYKKLFASTSE